MKRPIIPRDDADYRPAVGMMLLNADGLVFVARRIDTPIEAWQMPQGGIDPGEDPRQAALRELKEEIGTDRAQFLAESRDWLYYDIPDALRGQGWGRRYRGQRQKWFALRFTGRESDIDLAGDHPEFDAWKWVRAPELPEFIVPFKRDLYRAVVAEFEGIWGA